MNMFGIYKDYTEANEKRIKDLIARINSRRLDCQNITRDQNIVTINNAGNVYRCTREEEFFINKTNEFRKRLRNGETIDDIMVEALALVREAVRRRLGMFPYDTQLEAAISMIGGKLDNDKRESIIAEMKTGEGKSLVQILVAYLNVLEATKDENRANWTSVHVMTSNDALAKRDKLNNEKVFNLLGITTGFVPSRSNSRARTMQELRDNKARKQEAYSCDVVYATASSVAFDYLEDNTIYDAKNRSIKRTPGYAIVDEADDILIDQAINPLKLSQAPKTDGSTFDKYLIEREEANRNLYRWATNFLYGKTRKKPLTSKIFNQYFDNKDEKFTEDYKYFKDTKEVVLSSRISKEIGKDLGNSPRDEEIYAARYFALINCIKAKESFTNGVEYKVEVQNGIGNVVLIDQNIGRKKQTNKYTGGMQEAIEAKEEFLENDSVDAQKRYHIEYTRNNSIRAMFTYPDFMTIYKNNVCGMTGTSDEEEFKQLYGFETYRVKTRKRNIRIDEEAEVYATNVEKYKAILEEVIRCNKIGQPVLIGTTSVKESEIISSLLKKSFIRHQLLNANNEERENQIVENAGKFGMVTVSTNMAGRGTDIKLGPGVKEVGGLKVIGTSRNKSKRIDNQLMGRSARQGDPGITKYYSSLEDDLVKEYGQNSQALNALIELYKGKKIKNRAVIRLVEKSQQKRESKDKTSRLDNQKFYKSFREHRKIIYDNRNRILDSSLEEFKITIKNVIEKYIELIINEDTKTIERLIGHLVPVNKLYNKDKTIFKNNIVNTLCDKFKSNFDIKNIGNKDLIEYLSEMKTRCLDIIDKYWLNHIEYLEDLKSTITLGGNDDVFKSYEYMSNEEFIKNVIPSIYNEMITYILNPNLEYGKYNIKIDEKESERQMGIV